MSRVKGTMISAYPVFSQESTGGVSYPAFPLINDSPAQQTPSAPLHLGDKLIDKYGYSYVYVRAAAALAVGQVVKLAADTTGTISAGTTTALIKTNITTTIDEAQIESFLSGIATTGGATQVFTKKIKNQVINAGGAKIGANTNFYIAINDPRFARGGTDGDVLGFTPTTGDDLNIIRPYSVDVCGAAAAAEVPVGVALGTVTSGNRTLVQVSGLARVLGVGTGTAITDNATVITGAAGVVLGGTTAPSVVGIAKIASALASRLTPIWLLDLDGRL
jgi:hypothetical protein